MSESFVSKKYVYLDISGYDFTITSSGYVLSFQSPDHLEVRCKTIALSLQNTLQKSSGKWQKLASEVKVFVTEDGDLRARVIIEVPSYVPGYFATGMALVEWGKNAPGDVLFFGTYSSADFDRGFLDPDWNGRIAGKLEDKEDM